MFSKLAAFIALASPLLAVATPAAVARNTAPANPTTACCSSTVSSDSAQGIAALSSIAVVLSGLAVPIGLDCSPISVVGVGSGSACDSDPVSCSNGVVNAPLHWTITPEFTSLGGYKLGLPESSEQKIVLDIHWEW
ncbi:hypothetical protein PHLCEN_2v9194 [Hermanssonia centrifuga]|uniref:Hydrophobin n=1 Tax=Hermanssonia centrifuga TaxID=98765 RepID=A0A2R6NRG9_9APHY|nr:hypothetical protein PHLCEN_2v9194 [Hermanssonia centrifuga]